MSHGEKAGDRERREKDRRSHMERRGEVRFEDEKGDRRHLTGRRTEDRITSKVIA
ncbi:MULTISPECIES: hypothetical protein [unclassified Ferrimonas]|uniref:hypothetical protein n=1 Tax=unclassified Ferrimonas TaxID=2620587 RepID=UPI002573CA6B|nr:hypothetical protein [Ferrimonas sp. YFM]BDY03350.1 hypothetical protein F0521_03910 [Ferrimonas sp. YFM]